MPAPALLQPRQCGGPAAPCPCVSARRTAASRATPPTVGMHNRRPAVASATSSGQASFGGGHGEVSFGAGPASGRGDAATSSTSTSSSGSSGKMQESVASSSNGSGSSQRQPLIGQAATSGLAPARAGGGGGGLVGAMRRTVARWKAESKEMQAQLQEFGVAGVVAYGLLNTLYYTCTFLFVWVYVAKVPQGQGALVAARKCAEVLGIVWAGSQVTKVARAAGALLMAPVVDRGLTVVTKNLGLRSRQQAFVIVMLSCFALAFLLFGVVVVAWA